MKHVSILVPRGHSSLVNIEGTQQILQQVNQFEVAAGRPPVYDLHLVGLEKSTMQRSGMFSICPDILIGQAGRTDLIIIPAVYGDAQTVITENMAFAPWIVSQYKLGAEVASLCIGSFFLASTGLLNGRRCSTHWAMAGNFRQQFPAVNLVDDRIMTAEEGIYTSGGAYSFLNLLMYLVEKHAGRDMAVKISKTFMIDIDRNSQSPFIIFSGQKEHQDEPIKQAQEYIEQNFQDRITVDELAEKLAIGRRNLERRFKKATANTVVEYIQRVKMEAAKKGLEASRKNINEVMYEIGYNDTKAFRNTFKKITGLSPTEYRNKYGMAASPGPAYH